MAISYTSFQITKVGGVTKNDDDITINGKTAKKINGVNRSFRYDFSNYSSESQLDACEGIAFATVEYSYDSTLAVSSKLYTTNSMNVVSSDGWYKTSAGDFLRIQLTVVSEISVCPHTHTLNYDARSCATACAGSSPTDYYSADSSLSVGSRLYTDTALSTPVSTGYYSDSSSCFYIPSGQITTETECP